jgi:DNA-binding MurR/RpiR family transcriptional regulator
MAARAENRTRSNESFRGPIGQERFETMGPEMQRAARWICAHPTEAGVLSMREQARRCGVSSATMVRLAKTLGYSGFGGFARVFRERLFQVSSAHPYSEPAKLLQTGSEKGSGLSALCSLQQAACGWEKLNAKGQINRAARVLMKARRVGFLGTRASFGLAYLMHYVYSLIRINGVLLNGLAGTFLDQLDSFNSGDLLVAISQAPYAAQTVEAVQLARGQKIPVLSLTDSSLSPIALPAAQVLLFPAEKIQESFFHSMIGALSLIEALLATVARLGGSRVIRRLEMVENRLAAQKAYCESVRLSDHR